MEFIYNVPEEVKHYDKVFKEWNQMISSQDQSITNTITNIIKWWEEYPTKESKKICVNINEAPQNVWQIFEKFKITHTEKIFGIYYTLEYLFDEQMDLEISSIQFTDDGHVDIAVVIENFIVCSDCYYNVDHIHYTVIDKYRDKLKA